MCSILIYLSATFDMQFNMNCLISSPMDVLTFPLSSPPPLINSPPLAGVTPSFFPKSPLRPLPAFLFNIVFSYPMPLRILNAIISILISSLGSLPDFTQVPLTCPVFLRYFYLLLPNSNNSTIMDLVIQAQRHRVLVSYLLSLSNLPPSLPSPPLSPFAPHPLPPPTRPLPPCISQPFRLFTPPVSRSPSVCCSWRREGVLLGGLLEGRDQKTDEPDPKAPVQGTGVSLLGPRNGPSEAASRSLPCRDYLRLQIRVSPCLGVGPSSGRGACPQSGW